MLKTLFHHTSLFNLAKSLHCHTSPDPSYGLKEKISQIQKPRPESKFHHNFTAKYASLDTILTSKSYPEREQLKLTKTIHDNEVTPVIKKKGKNKITKNST